MKTRILSVMMVWAVSAFSLLAQDVKTEKFEVAGNCGMCKTRIEKAANSVDGVTSADWNQETKTLEVSFNKEKTDVHQIQMAIAKVGHDTPMHKAPDEVYEELPGCCKYERMDYTAHQH